MYYEAETQFHEWLGATLPQHLPETGQMLFYSPYVLRSRDAVS